jgi:hypothetical protein
MTARLPWSHLGSVELTEGVLTNWRSWSMIVLLLWDKNSLPGV